MYSFRGLVTCVIVLSALLWVTIFFVFHSRQDTVLNFESHSQTSINVIPLNKLLKSGKKGTFFPETRENQPTQPNNYTENRTTDLPHYGKSFTVDPTSTNQPNHKGARTSNRDTKLITPMTWQEFIEIPKFTLSNSMRFDVPKTYENYRCPSSIMKALADELPKSDFEWCEWALKPSGGGVVTWGDPHIAHWRSRTVPNTCPEGTSKVKCFDSDNKNRFCAFENIMIDFSRMHDKKRPSYTDTRVFDKGFISADCGQAMDGKDLQFWSQFAYDSSLHNSAQGGRMCEVVVEEPVLLYSHDDLRNLGHTISDFMNSWLISHLGDLAVNSKDDVVFLNMDSLRLGHSFHDQPNQFFKHYEVAYKRVQKAADYGQKRVCFKQLVMQPRPMVLFTWDGWLQDMPCTFKGPSSLFQRWNLQLRWRYGLLRTNNDDNEAHVAQILLLIRKGHSGDGSISPSRFIANTDPVIKMLKSIPNTRILAMDLSDFTFDQQMSIVGNTSIIIGMHGAGITHSMHMPIGTPLCCGQIEMYPTGEYTRIYGHGNMARKMGVYYERIDLEPQLTGGAGTEVPLTILKSRTEKLLNQLKERASCIHSQVLDDPYFEKSKVKSIWD